MPSGFQIFLKFLGVQNNTHINEQIISAIGGFFSILIIFSISFFITDLQGASAILPSMGASTVLLFAAPKGPLSQPWALLAGNVLSAFAGVLCYQWVDNTFLAASSAVSLSILLMFIFRCIHPPGGATALAAVIGGDAIHQLGFYYVIIPTLINCLIILSVALIFNNLFGWRRYPALKTMSVEKIPEHSARHIDERAIQLAINSLSEEISVHLTPTELKKIFDTSLAISKENSDAIPLDVGAFYSNSEHKFDWAVRQITGIYPHPDPEHHMVAFRVIEGRNKRRADSCPQTEFKDWAKKRVYYQ